MPANDLKELIAWLKANPDKASLGHIGPGSPAHVAGILFQKQTGTRFQFVNLSECRPSDAGYDRRTHRFDVRQPQHCFGARARRQHQGLCGHGQKPLAAASNIPTVDEAGLPGFYASPWFAFWAPKGTPRDVIDKLNAAVVDALADTAVRSRLANLGVEIAPREQQTPEALGTFQKAEIERWWPILKEAGIKVE